MAASGGKSALRHFLVCRVGAKLCGIPLAQVLETLRPLPTEPLAGLPAAITGLALIRGHATPVIDARVLLGGEAVTPPQRYVTLNLNAAQRRVAALAVDDVVGVRQVTDAKLGELPALLRDERELLSALGTLDQELLLVLEHARLLPEAVWQQLEQERASA